MKSKNNNLSYCKCFDCFDFQDEKEKAYAVAESEIQAQNRKLFLEQDELEVTCIFLIILMFTNLEMEHHTSNKFFEVNFEWILTKKYFENHLKKKFKKITRERYSKLNCFYI